MQVEKLSAFKANEQITVEYGTVHDVSDDNYTIQSYSGIYTAACAFSCVVLPEVGDKIMYSRGDSGQCYILSIIDRPAGNNASLSFVGNVTISSQQGNVTIAGSQGLQLASAQSLNMTSGDLNVTAVKGTIHIADMAATGEQFAGNISKIRIFANSIDSVADRLSQKLKNSFRMIEGVDQTRAGNVLTTVRKLFSVRARQSALLAKTDMKFDAERIHMG